MTGVNKGREDLLILSVEEDANGYGSIVKEDTHEARYEALQRARNRLLAATVLCLVVMIAEIVGGYVAHSLALMTDAAHMLVDFFSFVIAVIAIYLAKKQPSQRLTHGWHRAEVLGALFSVMLIWVMTGVLIYLGIKRTMTKRLHINTTVMISTASFGLFINVLLAFILHIQCAGGSCMATVPVFGHSHGHAEHQNVNLRAATLHVIGDIIQSLSVVIGAIVLHYRPDWTIIDPILTILFSVVVFLTTCRLFRDIIEVLMEAKPSCINFTDVCRRLVEIDGVEGVHSLRIWSLTTGFPIITVHLVIASRYDGEPANAQRILKEACHILETKFGVLYSTVQIEYSDDSMDYKCARSFGPSAHA